MTSHVTCHLSYVTYHLSTVTCQLLPVTGHLSPVLASWRQIGEVLTSEAMTSDRRQITDETGGVFKSGRVSPAQPDFCCRSMVSDFDCFDCRFKFIEFSYINTFIVTKCTL